MINDLRGKYRPFSNFWSCFIEFEGQVYPSVENAYQAAKMKLLDDREQFFYCKASEAKQLGKLLPMQPKWEEYVYASQLCETRDHRVMYKIVIMYHLVKQKFSKDDYLKQLLLETGDKEIQEGNWWGDTFWGTVNGKGENWLGRILMQVRKELRG